MNTLAAPQPFETGSWQDIEALIKNHFHAINTAEVTDIKTWLQACQQKKIPSSPRHPRIAVFVAAHGAFAELQKNLPQLLQAAQSEHSIFTERATAANADFRLYEMNITAPSQDFREGPAMTEAQFIHALAYGMMAVEPGVDVLQIHALNPIADIMAEKVLASKAPLLEAFLHYAGADLAAIMGALIAARLAKIPVIAEGKAVLAMADILARIRADGGAHVKVADDFAVADDEILQTLKNSL